MQDPLGRDEFIAAQKAASDFLGVLGKRRRQMIEAGTLVPPDALVPPIALPPGLDLGEIADNRATYALGLLESRKRLISEDMGKLVSLLEDLDVLSWFGFPGSDKGTAALQESLQHFCGTPASRRDLRIGLSGAATAETGPWIRLAKKESGGNKSGSHRT